MPYDEVLEEKLFSKAYENELERLTVSVCSYNKGPKKLLIARENKADDGEFRFVKLGRMNKKEVESILPFIQEAIGHM